MSGPSAESNAVLAAARSSACAFCAWAKATSASARLKRSTGDIGRNAGGQETMRHTARGAVSTR